MKTFAQTLIAKMINTQPENLTRMSVYVWIFCKFLRNEAKSPANITIKHCPNANAKSMKNAAR